MNPLRFLPALVIAADLLILGCSEAGGDASPTTDTDMGSGGSNSGDSKSKGGPNKSDVPAPTEGNGGAGGSTDTLTTTTSTSTSTTTTPAGGAGGGAGNGGSAGSGDGGTTGTTTTTTTTTTPIATCDPTFQTTTFYLSSDDSTSMGSPALAREFLRAGLAPPQDQIRIYEFLNYYRVRYDLPFDGELGLHAHMAAAGDDKYHLQVGVQAFDVDRPILALTFVVDTSGSLVGEGMAREKAALKAMAKELHAGDHVNFVTWSTKDTVRLSDHSVTGPDDPALLAVIEKLQPGGGSDLHTGLNKAYDLALATQTGDRLSRVVLISDGGANIGVLDSGVIASAAKKGDDSGIYLVGIGIGPAQAYSDSLMDQVTDAGRGAYVYLDSEREADAVLGKRFDEVMDIAARGVQVAVTLPSYLAFKEFYGEEMSTSATEVRPQHLAPGDSMVFNQVLQITPGGSFCDLDQISVGVLWSSPLLHSSSGAVTSHAPPAQTFKIADILHQPPQALRVEAITLYAKALKTRSKADFDAADAAIRRVSARGTIPGPYPEEIEEIERLLHAFPVTEINN